MLFVISMMLVSSQAQRLLVSESWTAQSVEPNPDYFPLHQFELLDWNPTATTSAGDLLRVGATTNADTDVTLTKISSTGTTLWTATYDGGNGNDYGSAVFVDNSGNAYLAGTAAVDPDHTDAFVVKYDANGVEQWTYTYDGTTGTPAEQFDVPIRVVTDFNGFTYLGVLVVDETSATEWVTIKLDATGNELWTNVFNSSSYHFDIPFFMKAGPSFIVLGGFAGSPGGDWHYVSRQISQSGTDNGTATFTQLANVNLADNIDLLEENGSVYIFGTTTDLNDGTGTNAQLVKVNPNGQVAWSNKMEKFYQNDQAIDLEFNLAGNLLLGANVGTPQGGTEIAVAEWDTDGNDLWVQTYRAPRNNDHARLRKLEAAGDYIYLAGAVQNGVTDDLSTLILGNTGRVLSQKFFRENTNSQESADNLVVVSDGYIVAGQSKLENNSVVYQTVKYERYEPDSTLVYASGVPSHKAAELIVKFHPALMDTTFVDDVDQRFGNLSDVLSDPATVSLVEDAIRPNRAPVWSKVFSRLTTQHTESVSRTGDLVEIPAFWSTMVLHLEGGEDLNATLNALNGLGEAVVEYAELNLVGQYDLLIPNDPFFPDQFSLQDEDLQNTPDNNINLEPAWDFVAGSDEVIVGIADAPMFWSHPDFGPGGFENSRVTDGRDFVNGVDIELITNPLNSHGTATGGIVGAIKDNGIGIAGIAGGGMDLDGNVWSGVQLHSMGIGIEAPIVAAAAEAIVEGAADTNGDFGFAQDIQNHSWGTTGFSATLRNAVEFASTNDMAVVASRGNHGTQDARFPASFQDNLVMSTGASGFNGDLYDGINGNLWATNNGIPVPGSGFGDEMDFIAPGITEHVVTTINPAAPFINFTDQGINVYPQPLNQQGDVQQFAGTSAAAPHVTGVSALMKSLHSTENGYPNDLLPEDLENLLQNYATNILIAGEAANGFDAETGFGRINASNLLEELRLPNFKVQHFFDPSSRSTTVQSSTTDDAVTIEELQVVTTYNITLDAGSVVLGNWGLLAKVNGRNLTPNAPSATYTFAVNGNNVTVTGTTNTSRITTLATGEVIFDPIPPNDIRTPFSLHLDCPLVTSDHNVRKEHSGVILYPNPVRDQLTLLLKKVSCRPCEVDIRDNVGRKVKSFVLELDNSESRAIPTSDLPAGMYQLILTNESQFHALGFIRTD